jgi:CRP/FNR family cyclic AMP-dependent transcriptional regulator
MTWVEGIGYLSAALAIAGSAMRTIIPLRCLGIATNIASLTFAVMMGLVPGMISNSILLPLNTYRLIQMLRLIKKVKQAANGDLSMEWLKPFMTRRTAQAGEILFAKGDTAECMFYTLTGRYRLKESGIEIPQGQVVGEMGYLAPDNRRTQTLECLEAGEVLAITYDELRQLYFQNPEFGFYFLRLTSERLFNNVAILEQEIARLRAASAAGRAA